MNAHGRVIILWKSVVSLAKARYSFAQNFIRLRARDANREEWTTRGKKSLSLSLFLSLSLSLSLSTIAISDVFVVQVRRIKKRMTFACLSRIHRQYRTNFSLPFFPTPFFFISVRPPCYELHYGAPECDG